MNVPDISRSDNEALARAGRDISQAFSLLWNDFKSTSPTFSRLAIKTIFKFLGDPQSEDTINQILTESGGLTVDNPPSGNSEPIAPGP